MLQKLTVVLAPVDGEAHGRAADVVARQHHRQRVCPLDGDAVLDRVRPVPTVRHLRTANIVVDRLLSLGVKSRPEWPCGNRDDNPCVTRQVCDALQRSSRRASRRCSKSLNGRSCSSSAHLHRVRSNAPDLQAEAVAAGTPPVAMRVTRLHRHFGRCSGSRSSLGSW